MITFKRYPHIQDLFEHYARRTDRQDILDLLARGIHDAEEAETLCRFAWHMAELINTDGEHGTEVLPDLSYEMTLYMKQTGFYATWERVSNEEMP